MSKLGLASLMHGYSTGLNLQELRMQAEKPYDSCASFLRCVRARSIADMIPVGEGRYAFPGDGDGDYARVNNMTEDLESFLLEQFPEEVMLAALAVFSKRKWKHPGWWISGPEFEDEHVDTQTGRYFYNPEQQFDLSHVGVNGVPPGCRNKRSAYGGVEELETSLRLRGVVTTVPLLWAYMLVNNNRNLSYPTVTYFEWNELDRPTVRRRV